MPHARVPKTHPDTVPSPDKSPIHSTEAEIDPRPVGLNEADLQRSIEASTRRLEELARAPVPIEEEIEIA